MPDTTGNGIKLKASTEALGFGYLVYGVLSKSLKPFKLVDARPERQGSEVRMCSVAVGYVDIWF